MAKISVVINTLNEEKNIQKALFSVKDFADEVVVVDMHSTDQTQDIAKKFGAKVFQFDRVGYVEPARNYAISKASGDYILILDADERVPSSLGRMLKKLADSKNADYYRIARKNVVFGKWLRHSRWWPDYNIRFFKKGSVSWNEIIHSVPLTSGKGSDLPADKKLAICHFHYQTIEQYLDRANRYTSWQADALAKQGYKFNWSDLISKPSGEFLSRYFLGEGYKDGIHGLALSLLQSFSELLVYLKMWQSGGFEKNKLSLTKVISEMKKRDKDAYYWRADAIYKDTGSITSRFKRKFKLP
jgi:(heptosyl)LPS beta-1,4-glucosyltransferase